MDFLALIFLIERHGAEDGGEHHAGRVNPDKVAMEADGAAGFYAGYFGSFDRVIRGGGVHGDGRGSKRDVQVYAGVARSGARSGGIGAVALLFCSAGGEEGGGHGRQGDDAESLVDLEVVRPLVEPLLQLRIGLSLLRGESEIAERGLTGVLLRRRLLV